MPKISIIVPVYNTEVFLRECIDGIIAQTFKDFEVLLIDDGSTDLSGSICGECSSRYPQIRTFHQSNQGQSVARNFALSKADSEWLLFVDSDDILHPHILEYLYTTATECHTSLVLCNPIGHDTVPEDFFLPVSATSRSLEVNDTSLLYLVENDEYYYWVPWCKLIRTSIVKQYPFAVGKIYEDNAIVFRWLIAASEITLTDAKLYFYRVSQTRTTSRPFSEKTLDCLWALEENINYYRKRSNYPHMRTWLCNGFFSVAKSFYVSACKFLSETSAPNSIVAQMRRIARQNRKYCRLSTSERIQLYEIIYPKRMYLYWQFKGILSRVQSLFK